LFKITYLWARKETNDDLKKQLNKEDQKKLEFVDIDDLLDVENRPIEEFIGKQYRPDQAINELIKELELKSGNIYKTRLDIKKLLIKSKQIAILSYSDYVNRVNTKLSVAIQTGQPYKDFIKLVKSDGVPNMSLFDLVDNKGYWKTVFRTNMSTIFHGGYLDQVNELKEFIEYEEYNAIILNHEQCKSLNGVIRPVGEFEANGNSIPAGYNCTAFFTIVSKVVADANNIKATENWNEKVKPADGFGGKTTINKTSTLPKTVTKRLPAGWNNLI